MSTLFFAAVWCLVIFISLWCFARIRDLEGIVEGLRAYNEQLKEELRVLHRRKRVVSIVSDHHHPRPPSEARPRRKR